MILKVLPNDYKEVTTVIIEKDASMMFKNFKTALRNFEEAEKTDDNTSPRNHHHHYHHVRLSARIFLTLSRHHSLFSIAFDRSSGLHWVSAQSCSMYVQSGRPAFARLCEGVHRSTSITSSSLLLQQCPACLVRLILIVFATGRGWPYSCCFVGCCLQDLFNIARSILA